MTFLYWAGQGKKHRGCAAGMGCSIHSVETTIRKNMGGVSWAEAVEMTRDMVQAHRAQLPVQRNQPAQSTLDGVDAAGEDNLTGPSRFLFPVLMEAFRLFGQGATTVEAARALGLSETTLQGRRGRILKAYGTSMLPTNILGRSSFKNVNAQQYLPASIAVSPSCVLSAVIGKQLSPASQ